MSMSKKNMRILLRTALAGKPVCLVEFRLVETDEKKERFIAFVLGDADKMDSDAIFGNIISRLTYSMNPKARKANIAHVRTKQDAYKRYGLQESLFAYALKDMLEHGCSVADLCWTGKKEAYAFYSKFGFKLIDAKFNTMELVLSKYTVKKMYVRTEKEREEAIRKANKAESPERKAIFSGDFDPFHSGHAYAIKTGLEFADKVLVYVTDRSGWIADQKTRKSLIRKYIRLKGLQERVLVYDGGKNSHQLAKEGYPIKICGSDLFSYPMQGLRHPEPVMAAEEVVVLIRPMHTHPPMIPRIRDYLNKLGKPYHIVPSKTGLGDLSAEGVRRRIRSGERITGLVPPEIEEDIIRVYRPLLAD